MIDTAVPAQHGTDWYVSVLSLAGVNMADITTQTGPLPPDGMNILPALLANASSPRTEIVHNIDERSAHSLKQSAIRVGDWKLIVGYPGCTSAGRNTPGNQNNAKGGCYNGVDFAWKPPEMTQPGFDVGVAFTEPAPCSLSPCLFNSTPLSSPSVCCLCQSWRSRGSRAPSVVASSPGGSVRGARCCGVAAGQAQGLARPLRRAEAVGSDARGGEALPWAVPGRLCREPRQRRLGAVGRPQDRRRLGARWRRSSRACGDDEHILLADAWWRHEPERGGV